MVLFSHFSDTDTLLSVYVNVFTFNEILRDFKQTNISARYIYFCVTVFAQFCYIIDAKQLYQR
jgi:hypothetical protein